MRASSDFETRSAPNMIPCRSAPNMIPMLIKHRQIEGNEEKGLYPWEAIFSEEQFLANWDASRQSQFWTENAL